MFADLHCHPTGRNYHYFSIDKRIFDAPVAQPWHIVPSRRRKINEGLRAGHYSQSDFARLIAGQVKIVFASLYPFEQGFVQGEAELSRLAVLRDLEYFDSLLEEGLPPHAEAEYETWKSQLIENNLEIMGNKARLHLFLHYLLSGIPIKRLEQIRGPQYNYWDELGKEYDFITRRSGLLSRSTFIELDVDGNNTIGANEKTEVEGKYWILAHNSVQVSPNGRPEQPQFASLSDVEAILQAPNQLAVVLTIEGMHALSMRNHEEPIGEDELIERIRTIKKWDPPIFFITFAHHFNNNLCSHAHSIPDIGIPGIAGPNQLPHMNHLQGKPTDQGLTEIGYRAMLELLHLKDENGQLQLQTSASHRILIDTKHMSASARKNFYDRIIKPYNQVSNINDRIPVIASHSAYSGRHTLVELINNYKLEKNDSSINKFNSWNINLCDQDIQVIAHSGGLIGICFDQRILGLSFDVKRDILGIGRDEEKINFAELIVNNVKAIARAAFDGNDQMHRLDHEASVWNCLAIGTDFDGMIDPANPYATAASFPRFKEDMRIEMLKWGEEELLLFGISEMQLDIIIEKICVGNALQFLKRHFNKLVQGTPSPS